MPGIGPRRGEGDGAVQILLVPQMMAVDLVLDVPRGVFRRSFITVKVFLSQFVTNSSLKPFDSILFFRELLHALIKLLGDYLNMALMSIVMLSSSIHFLFLYI